MSDAKIFSSQNLFSNYTESTEAEAELLKLQNGFGHVPGIRIWTVRVSGSDAGDYLNRRASQKIIDMKDGEIRRAMLLDGVGKIEQDFDILYEKGTESFLLFTSRYKGAQLAADIDKYIFAEDCTVENLGEREASFKKGDGDSYKNNLSAYTSDLFGGRLTFEGDVSGEKISASTFLDYTTEESIIIFGVDFTEDANPLEAGLERGIHFDKGCYPGQETIATITNLGHPARKFVTFKLNQKPENLPCEVLTPEGQKAGKIVRCNSSENLATGWVKWPHRNSETILKTECGIEVTVN